MGSGLELSGWLFGAVGLLLAIYGAWVTETQRIEDRNKLTQTIARLAPLIFFCLLVIAAGAVMLRLPSARIPSVILLLVAGLAVLWPTRVLHNLRLRIAELEVALDACLSADPAKIKGLPINKTDRGRWKSFDPIKFGHIHYPPLLEHDLNGNPTGLGPELLDELIGDVVKLSDSPKRSTWSSFHDELDAGKFGVVATPLFATFDRSLRSDFTAPLFYSNIGLFVSRPYAEDANLNKLTYEEIKQHLKSHAVTLLGLDEEISEKLARKHASADSCLRIDREVTLSSLFGEVARSSIESPKAIFSETFFGRSDKNVIDGKVVNILKRYELIYPVCFALKPGDYQLKNLLNLRLLRLASQGGALKKLARQLSDPKSNVKPPISEAEVYEHFIAEWPYGHVAPDPLVPAGGQTQTLQPPEAGN